MSEQPTLSASADGRARMQTIAALVLLGVLNLAMTFGARRAHDVSDNLFLALVTSQAGLAIVAAVLAARLAPRTALLVVIAGGIAIRLPLLAAPPLLSDDLYRYVWDGRILNAGFNPYLHVPADPALAPFRDDAIYPHVDMKDYAVSIYPPVAQALFFIATRLSDSVLGIKLAMLSFEALGVGAMVALLAQLRVHPARLALYLWHPFAAWEIANNAHADTIMMGMAFAGFAWLGFARPYRLSVVLAAGALVKPFGALFLPSVWRPWDIRLPLFVLAVVLVCYLPFVLAGGGMFGFFGRHMDEHGLSSGTGLFFVLMAYKLGAPPLAYALYLATSGLVLLALAMWLAMNSARDMNPARDMRPARDLRRRLAEAATLILAFLFLLTPVYPWYFIMVAPFVALLGSWCAFAMITTGFWLYGFLPDQIEFIFRWSAAIALVAVGGGVDLWRARRAMAA